MLQSFWPVFRVIVSGMGLVGERGDVALGAGGSKEITSDTRMLFSGSRVVGRSKAPFRWDW